MARTRGPGNLVSHAPRTEARSDTRAHSDYDAMIAHDLGGRRRNSYRAIDDGGPASTAELLLRPISLFLFACTAFVIVLLAWLWQTGIFGQMQLRFTPRDPVPSSSWIGGRQARTIPPADTTEAATLPGANALTGPADTAPSDDTDSATSSSSNDNTTG